jgi:hypothetical protein
MLQFSGPEVTWLDGRKLLFSVGLRLASTLATTDVHLHNLFAHAERLLEPRHAAPPPSEQETSKVLKVSIKKQLFFSIIKQLVSNTMYIFVIFTGWTRNAYFINNELLTNITWSFVGSVGSLQHSWYNWS